MLARPGTEQKQCTWTSRTRQVGRKEAQEVCLPFCVFAEQRVDKDDLVRIAHGKELHCAGRICARSSNGNPVRSTASLTNSAALRFAGVRLNVPTEEAAG